MFDYAKATFKRWQVSTMGQKPTDEMLTTASYFAKATPGKFVMALAMALRPEGTTGAQMQNAVGDPKHNVRRELIKAGMFTYLDAAGADIGKHGHFSNAANHRVYRVALTAKGERFIKQCDERALKAAVKAANGGATPSKPKVKKPTGEPGKPAEGPTAEAISQLVTDNPALATAIADHVQA